MDMADSTLVQSWNNQTCNIMTPNRWHALVSDDKMKNK